MFSFWAGDWTSKGIFCPTITNFNSTKWLGKPSDNKMSEKTEINKITSSMNIYQTRIQFRDIFHKASIPIRQYACQVSGMYPLTTFSDRHVHETSLECTLLFKVMNFRVQNELKLCQDDIGMRSGLRL